MFKEIIIGHIADAIASEDVSTERTVIINAELYFLAKFFHDHIYT